jgi:hypothetical protein
MNIDIYDIFYYSCLSISAVTGMICLKKTDRGFKWLIILIIFTLCSELLAKYIAHGLDKPNNIVYHVFTPFEYAIYVIIFNHFMARRKWQTLLKASAIGLMLFEVINSLFFQSLRETNTNVMIVESAFLVLLSLLLFLIIRETPSPGNLLREGVFWFNSAVLCYYSFNILIWGFHNMKVYTLENPPQFMYDFNLILSGLLYMTYTTAILLHTLTKTTISNNLG